MNYLLLLLVQLLGSRHRSVALLQSDRLLKHARLLSHPNVVGMQPLLELREFDGVAAILVELVENVLDFVPLEFLVDFLEQDSKLVHTQAFVSGVVQFFEQFVEVEVIGNNSLAQVIYNVFGLVFQLRIVVDKRLEVPFEQGISINVIPRRPNFFLRVQTSSQEVLRFF